MEGRVGDFHEVGNRELEEAQVNNDIEENRLGNQYKLIRRNEKFSRERSQKIIEREMAGIRKGIPNWGSYNCYGNAGRQIEIGDLGEHGAYIRAPRRNPPKDEVSINGRFANAIKHKPLKAGNTKRTHT